MKRIWEKYWKILVGGLWLSVVIALAVWLTIFDAGITTIDSRPEFLRGIGLFLLGAGVAPLGLFLAHNRTESLKLQSETDKEKTLTEKEKAVTEAFAKSVELLGHQRDTARQGGVYALGRLADNYPDLHPMIMDIVASYIRQESSRWFNAEREKRGVGKPVDELIKELHPTGMPMDIEAAIAVIRKRKVDNDKKPVNKEYVLDLSNAYIFNANLSHTSLINVNFSDSVMAHCIFDETKLCDSYCKATNFEGSSMTQEQVNSLKEVDGKTILPEGLSFPA